MSFLYSILGLLVTLGILVTIHEYGHFWVARRCGVKVLRFSVGFGKPLVRWHDRRDIEFVIAAIPLGGYVKMLDAREGEVDPGEYAEEFTRKPVAQRIAIVVAGPLSNLLLALLLFWVLAMMGSQQLRPVVGEVTPGGIAAQGGLRPGDEILAVDGVDTPSWNAVGIRLTHRLGETGSIRLKVQSGVSSPRELDLPLSAWMADAEDPDPVQGLGMAIWRPQVAAQVNVVGQGSPAEQGGLRQGDRILALDGNAVADWTSLVAMVGDKPAARIRLEIDRQGERIEVPVVLQTRMVDGREFGYLGVSPVIPDWPPEMIREVSWGSVAAIGEAWRRTLMTVMLVFDSLKKMVVGELSVKNLSGPITIAKVAGVQVRAGIGSFLNFLAYLSVTLGIFNLLPIPVLDGGHLLFYVIEWLRRGKPLSERVQVWGMQIGLGLIVMVMVLSVFNDLGRL